MKIEIVSVMPVEKTSDFFTHIIRAAVSGSNMVSPWVIDKEM